MKEVPFKFTIGQGNWVQEIRYFTTELNPNYWADFHPLSAKEIQEIEQMVARKLPEDYKMFLEAFGWGQFPEPYGDNFFSPEEFRHRCHRHLFLLLGSSRWASDDEQRQFYVTHGSFNPAPRKFTAEALDFENINLLDFLPIGNDLSGCFHLIDVGPVCDPVGYCLVTPQQTLEDDVPSFSEGLKLILTRHWRWDDDSDDDPQDLPPLFEFEP